MRRVSVVGPSGSGKTTLGRALAERLGVPFVELDATISPTGRRSTRTNSIEAGRDHRGDGSVIDGNYDQVVRDGPVWERADTVVWLDLPKSVVMWRVIRRTVGRAVLREELWNGNRERPTNIFRWDPEQSIIRWAWTTHGSVRRRYGTAR